MYRFKRRGHWRRDTTRHILQFWRTISVRAPGVKRECAKLIQGGDPRRTYKSWVRALTRGKALNFYKNKSQAQLLRVLAAGAFSVCTVQMTHLKRVSAGFMSLSYAKHLKKKGRAAQPLIAFDLYMPNMKKVMFCESKDPRGVSGNAVCSVRKKSGPITVRITRFKSSWHVGKQRSQRGMVYCTCSGKSTRGIGDFNKYVRLGRKFCRWNGRMQLRAHWKGGPDPLRQRNSLEWNQSQKRKQKRKKVKKKRKAFSCDTRWSNGKPAWSRCTRKSPFKMRCMWQKTKAFPKGQCVTKKTYRCTTGSTTVRFETFRGKYDASSRVKVFTRGRWTLLPSACLRRGSSCSYAVCAKNLKLKVGGDGWKVQITAHGKKLNFPSMFLKNKQYYFSFTGRSLSKFCEAAKSSYSCTRREDFKKHCKWLLVWKNNTLTEWCLSKKEKAPVPRSAKAKQACFRAWDERLHESCSERKARGNHKVCKLYTKVGSKIPRIDTSRLDKYIRSIEAMALSQL